MSIFTSALAQLQKREPPSFEYVGRFENWVIWSDWRCKRYKLVLHVGDFEVTYDDVTMDNIDIIAYKMAVRFDVPLPISGHEVVWVKDYEDW